MAEQVRDKESKHIGTCAMQQSYSLNCARLDQWLETRISVGSVLGAFSDFCAYRLTFLVELEKTGFTERENALPR
jgi:hypothetical protein